MKLSDMDDCARRSAIIAGLAGLASFLLFLIAGGWGFFASLFIGALTGVIAGAVLMMVMCKGASASEEAWPTAAIAQRPVARPESEGSVAAAKPGPTAGAAKQADAERTVAPNPAATPEPEPSASNAGTRPSALDNPRGGAADDLKRIKGIGPKLEKQCNAMGFYHFDQIAAWTEDEINWVDQNLEGFKGRVRRDHWVAQARDLAAEG